MSTVDVPGVTAAQALALLGDGAHLLDVREANEWAAGHDPRAQFVPLAQVAGSVDSLPVDRTILVICRSGNRSKVATELLRATGRDAVNVEGGMRAWQEAGGDVLRTDGTAGSVI